MKQHDIILIADEPWENFTWRRRHHVAWALAKHNRVLFIEPPYTVFSPIRNKYIRWKQLLNLGRLKHQGRNLYSYSPWKLVPLTIAPSAKVDEVNKKVIFYHVRRAAKKLGMKKPILWTYFSLAQYEYYGLFGEKLTITDCYDKFTASFGLERTKDYQAKICNLHNNLLERANIAFATSKELYDDIKKVKPESYYIPHGVDIDMYLRNDRPQHEIFEDLEKIKKPVLGYLGSIQHKIDFELLRRMAASHPEWSLVFVGKTAINNATDMSDWNMLKKMENVYYFKEVERECIPSILSYFDICMLPFKKIEWQHYAANLKIWEYLAAGKPTVAIDQNADYTCNDLMYIVDDKIGFEKAVEHILSIGEDDKLVEERKMVALKNSWDHRIAEMLNTIDDFLLRKDASFNLASSKDEPLTILCIHGVTKNRRFGKTANFEGRHIQKDYFRDIVRYIRQCFNPIDLAQLEGFYYAGKPLPKNPILITFDDGFANNYYHAFPILRECDCPATIFLATGYIGNNREYWVEKLEYSIYKTGRKMLEMSILGRDFILPIRTVNEKEFAYKAVLRFLKSGFNFSKVDEAVGHICDYLGFFSPSITEDSEDYRFLTWEQVKEMRKSGITFGAHTVNHVNLAFEDMPSAEAEAQGAKLAIEKELGEECSAFCYPFGRSGYSESLEGLLKRTGYKFSFQLGGDVNYKNTNPLLLSRICLEWGMKRKDLMRHIFK